ncbi:hypothetical protein T484DRAFT_1918628 [Baffinella frigidus]|nr:hypothetical protein T484DRAFT_1918628 [Cryptophyta sp. CCMP2293]
MALRAMFFSSWMGRRLLGLGLGSEESNESNSESAMSLQESPSVSPRPAAGVGHTTAEESSTRFGIRKWWRLNIDSAKKWWETGVNDFNEQAAEALAKIRSQAAATEAAAEDNRASPAISEDHGSEGTSAPTGEEAGQGSVAAPADAEIGVADKWTRSLKTMQLQTATALQHMVQTSKETGKKLADVWDIHDLVDDVAEQKDRWESHHLGLGRADQKYLWESAFARSSF